MRYHPLRSCTLLAFCLVLPAKAAPGSGGDAPPAAAAARVATVETGGQKAAEALIGRLLPADAGAFKIELIPAAAGRDVFEMECVDGKIVLRGNNAGSIASALNCYLKEVAHCDIGWCGTNLALAHPLPVFPGKIRRVSPYRYRYYLNYCTFNYSLSWWEWERWEREIDWMALNGINMPLALTGQNSVLRRVYQRMGFTDAELDGFFSGPAYFAWFWMGNLDGWGGPLPTDFMDHQEALQKRILARERELGMTPILPAFAGHVPSAFAARFPKARLKRTNWDQGFADVTLLDPSDPAFTEIGRQIIEEEIRTFGTDHFYSADTFNENRPPSGDPAFLSAASREVFRSMAAVDPAAVWVMQGWLFSSDRDFWKPERIKAFLDGVPNDRMVILDLYDDLSPMWKRTDSFCGKPWIWCMLHNFGGQAAMSGRFPVIAANPADALADPKAGKLEGIGLTPEAIGQNPVVYELMMENVWRDTRIDTKQWLAGYVLRRYGAENADAQAAWRILARTAYAGLGRHHAPASIVTRRPVLECKTGWYATALGYDPSEILPAWDRMLAASGALGDSDGFRYDLVDLTRQILADYAEQLQQEAARAWAAGDVASFQNLSGQFLRLIDDMDRLLATRREFLLGTWLADARSLGSNPAESDLFERNARDQITLWGGPESTLHDYAAKQWSGLLKAFYKPRWEQFFAARSEALTSRHAFDQAAFERQLEPWEWRWVNGHEAYPDVPTGDAIEVAKALYARYRAILGPR